MRILGGIFKGRSLQAPKRGARPTQSVVKAAIFNILGPSVEGARFLDICAGSGAVAFEAVSRGAAEAILIEQGKEPLKAIYDNIEALQCIKNIRVIAKEATAALTILQKEKNPFDMIYVDPPYEDEVVRTSILTFFDKNTVLMTDSSILFLEVDKGATLPQLQTLSVTAQRRYGDTILYQLAKQRSFSDTQ